MMPPIRGELDDIAIAELKSYFKWTSFCVGENVVHVTPSGGVHWSGKAQIYPSVMFEVTRKNTYFIVHLNQYTQGVIFHLHVFLPQLNKISNEQKEEVAKTLYDEVQKIISKE